MEISTPMKIILVLLVVIISIFIYNKFIKSQQTVLGCTKMGGQCVDNTCSFKQIAYLGDKAVGCQEGQLCCINITNEPSKDERCDGKIIGASCGENLYCNRGEVCVTLCDYCTKNRADPGTVDCKVNGKDFPVGAFTCQKISSTDCDNKNKNPNGAINCTKDSSKIFCSAGATEYCAK
jgi:hypothetical protein